MRVGVRARSEQQPSLQTTTFSPSFIGVCGHAKAFPPIKRGQPTITMPIRQASYADIPAIARVFAASFGPDELFQIMYPYQDEYYEDFVTVLRRKLREHWWNYSMVLMVSYLEDAKQEEQQVVDDEVSDERRALLASSPPPPKSEKHNQIITGAAVWQREGPGWETLWHAYGRWDPRLLVRQLLTWRHALSDWLRPCRAAARPSSHDPDPVHLGNLTPRLAPFAELFLRDAHAPRHWSLEMLAVHPRHQGRGFGRALAERGLRWARDDALSTVVISAAGKEGFYRKLGFGEPVGYTSAHSPAVGYPNPLAQRGIGGGACMWCDP